MKYVYLYQTSGNENRKGEIKARNRAEAYATLRKQGIRPYRLIGDDPKRWQPWAAGAAFAAVAAFSAYLLVSRGGAGFFYEAGKEPARRCQLPASAALSEGLAAGWQGVFKTNLDRFLAAYAQPGWIAIPPDFSDGEIDSFPSDLATPLDFPEGEAEEIRLLRRIVLSMRAEFAGYLASGGTVRDYLAFLEERQDEERALRENILKSAAGPGGNPSGRDLVNANMRLRELGLPEIGG